MWEVGATDIAFMGPSGTARHDGFRGKLRGYLVWSAGQVYSSVSTARRAGNE